ncbi:DUF2510 domain-containing protein [Streptomyces prasinopilosus]|uniref:DUF2510 domain-containing protein n=1 Tax=Streptomyces prasinopilosus TaxID=67344 RepID=A0A1G6MLR7_9ACTN|nr:DUF2510 domain-containing protein [Streptomyces prasinopilosus]SDC56472.1 Protein of unknown function [Streptomyces prasinopilosus]
MTQATPPGWYPDPGQTNDGPATERWWDGTAWTDQVRPTASAPAWAPPVPGTAAGPAHPAPPAYPVYPAHPGYPGYPGAVRSGRGRGLRIGIAVAAAVAVLASIGVGVYALTDGGGSGSTSTASRAPGGRDDGPGGPGGGPGEDGPGPDGSEAPRVESGSVTDALSGISLPIPDGWYGQEGQVGAQIMSEDTYDCPGDTSSTCTKGGAYSAPAQALGSRGSTAEAVAKADISANAEESYGGDSYGKISSHEVLESKAVTVAGQKGYLVRWKAVTSKGSDGYVQSLAFPSPAQPERMVVVRFGLDTDQKQSVLDDITEGIEKAEGGGRGNGQDV